MNLYLAAGVEVTTDEDGKERSELLYVPEAVIAHDEAAAKNKVLIRWGVTEDEFEGLKVHVIPFQVVA